MDSGTYGILWAFNVHMKLEVMAADTVLSGNLFQIQMLNSY